VRILWQDLYYGLRVLRKNRAFTFVAVLTLAMGIGANTSIFSLANALLLRGPQGIDRPQQLVLIGRSQTGSDYDTLSYPDYVDFRDSSTSFAELAAYREVDLHLTNNNAPVSGMLVSGNYFGTLGTGAERGRVITSEDDSATGASPVALISFGLWQRRFGSDPNIVGRVVDINNYPFTVVGVAPRGFTGTEITRPIDIWLPLTMYSQAEPDMYEKRLELRHISWLGVLGRLKPEVSAPQAQADLMTISRRLEQTYPDVDKGLKVNLWSGLGLQPQSRGEAETRLGILLAIAGLVLLIVCANVANLFLARSVTRRKEMAVRRALGASTPRIVRQLLTEALLISLVGGVLGLLVAFWSKPLLLRSDIVTGVRLSVDDLRLDVRVFGFALLISVLTGLIFGLAPAFDASHLDLQSMLKDRVAGLSTRQRFRALPVIVEIALSVVVLISAGLFVRTLLNTQSVNPGFSAERILTMPIDVGGRGLTEAAGRNFYDDLNRHIEAAPGVRKASLAITRPLGGQWRTGFRLEGQTAAEPETSCDYNIVTPGYFETLGIPLLSGRDFSTDDRASSPGVVIVGEEFARRIFPGANPLGRRILIPRYAGDRTYAEVIGVVRDIKYESLTETPRPYFYLPLAQRYQSGAMLMVRSTASDATLLTGSISREVAALDKNLPIYGIRTLNERLQASLAGQRSVAMLLAVFGLLALALATIGIYGVLAYSVGQRQQEIGIRMALGANTHDVLKLILRQGAILVLAGVTTGSLLGQAAMRLVASQLYGVSALDPLVYATVLFVLATTAFVACFIPARRATKVDPLVALRYE
jgi:putative ABC transport system permease protein